MKTATTLLVLSASALGVDGFFSPHGSTSLARYAAPSSARGFFREVPAVPVFLFPLLFGRREQNAKKSERTPLISDIPPAQYVACCCPNSRPFRSSARSPRSQQQPLFRSEQFENDDRSIGAPVSPGGFNSAGELGIEVAALLLDIRCAAVHASCQAHVSVCADLLVCG